MPLLFSSGKVILLFTALEITISVPFIIIFKKEMDEIYSSFSSKLLLVFFVPAFIALIIQLKIYSLLSEVLQKKLWKLTSAKQIITILFVGVALPFLITIPIILVGNGIWEFNEQTNWFSLVYIFHFILFAGIEEILCRFILLEKLMRQSNCLTAIIISSLIFACLHLLNPSMSIVAFINLFLSGLVFSLLYISYNKNLLLVIAAHALWNYTSGIFIGSNVSGLKINGLSTLSVTNETIINGGNFGIEGSIFCLFLLLLFITFLIMKNVNGVFYLRNESIMPKSNLNMKE